MNETAIALVFSDPGRALKERTKPAWEPNKRYKALHDQYQQMVDSTPTQNAYKRNRYDSSGNYGNKTYKHNHYNYAQAVRINSGSHDNYNNESNDTASITTIANLTNSTDYKLNMEEIKIELRGEFKLQMEDLKKVNAEIKQSLIEFQTNCQTTQAKQESSLDRIETFMKEQKFNYDEQFTRMNSMFMMFMSTQMKDKTPSAINGELNALTKRKLYDVQKDQDIGKELPTNKDEAIVQLNRMEEDEAVDHSGRGLTTTRTKND
jgi:hypothetical protein